MKVRQFRYGSDNMGYLVYGSRNAVAIDAGAVDEMIAFAENNSLCIRVVTNTHTHFDHTLGNESISRHSGAELVDCRAFVHGSHIFLDDEKLTVFKTPGHMDDCVTFWTDGALITGDTLFNGTVGNCFSGDLKSFFESIRFLMTFPPETSVYAGHDYVRESMAFARFLEQDNPVIDRYLAQYDPSHVVFCLEDELKVNPFLRFNDPAMIRILGERGLSVETEYDRWNSLMSLG